MIAVVGHPGHRRVELFAAAVRSFGLPEPTVLPWAEVLRGQVTVPAGALVRVDSPGEDPAVDTLLRGPDCQPTRVEGSAVWYAGLLGGLATLAAAVGQAPDARLLADPAETAVMFDKRRTHARLTAAGLPVPTALGQPVGSWPELRELLAAAGLRRVFVKPAHASSASGVLALEFGPDGRLRATTSVELTPTGLHNSLRVRSYTTEPEIAAVVDALAPDGLHVEQWIPKASQHGRSADLRVVAVHGRVTHAVVRTGAGPLTNLHLGGARGDLALVRAAAGPHWAGLLELGERVAACFPGSPMVGIDVLPGAGWRRWYVGEVNAFGDLLPKLPGLPEGPAAGLDTYGAQVQALLGTELGTER
ncbi:MULTISPECIES: STM4014 family protein [unclassified Kitasatospora]|uniref:STM4014 family protein n=1 Tax=unclassified Kitasatospora TaxID=2633591 RepID=UPI000B0CD1FE|nr:MULTISPECIES: STM4014 family protein [unclassified Kitasatospora]